MMRRYQIGEDPGPLEDWPFDNPLSDYKILSGAPRASGRLDSGGTGHTTRAGIWRCTKGQFSCIEQGDEMMTVLSGRGRLTDMTSGKVQALAPGDTLFIHDAMHALWDIEDELTKAFFGYKADGY